MRQFSVIALSALFLAACGGGKPAESPADESTADAGEASSSSESSDADPGSEDGADAGASDGNTFQLKDSTTARDAHGETESKIKATATEAAMKFFVVDKEKEQPISGIVISMTSPDGKKFFTNETDSTGYAEVLVPVGQDYDLVYLSLGRQDITAKVPVKDLPNQNIKLTLRYKGWTPKPRAGKPLEPVFVLDGVTFDTGKATIKPESFKRLDGVVEYLTHKKSAKIEISGHTDNVGDPKTNKALSLRRAEACRKYLTDKGIEGSRITAIGHGDEQPVASNDTPAGRAQNRRIEAKEL